MSELQDRVRDVLRAADVAVMRHALRIAGATTSDTRAWLRARGLPFVDGDARPSDAELARTASEVIARTRTSVQAAAGLAGLGGLASLGPEVAARLAGALRLSQRLAVVYGFDPETPFGATTVLRTLASAYDVSLPEQGLSEPRVTALVSALRPGSVDRERLGEWVVRGALTHTGRRLVGIGRLVPVVGAVWAARDAHRDVSALGARMAATLSARAEAVIRTDVVEAEEVGPARPA